MSQFIAEGDRIAQRGQECYAILRDRVEIAENMGKIIAIDVATGDHDIGNDLLEVSLRLKAKRPQADLWAERIGFNAVYSLGGTLTRMVE
jgi:hypothetical protein